jgi:hypothetical protein
MRRDDIRSLIGLLLACGAAFLLTASLPSGFTPRSSIHLAAPVIDLHVVAPGQCLVTLKAEGGADIRYTLDGSAPNGRSELYSGPFVPNTEVQTARLIATPTSVQWRHPVGNFPSGIVVRARAFDDQGRPGPIAVRTMVPKNVELPVFSLTIPGGALFDPDTGIYVVGNAIFQTGEDFVKRYPRDQKWWKYPGNFHLRGRNAEREGHLEYFAPNQEPDDMPMWACDVGLRINGNNTRGFPQHALRVILHRSDEDDLLPDRMILRTAGNDQDHAFFRDALQHRLCKGLPFATSGCVQSVLYVNGAYWGLHEMRSRIDEKAIARAYGVKPKDITIIEDRITLYEGKEEELKTFSRFLTMTEHWDASGRAFVDSLERRMDVDGFLTYMAAQIILSNTDWPEQNVRWWRFTGTPDTVPSPRDGRWRFIMGDSDMGMGLATGPDYDMFKHIDRHPTAPIARLFKSCLRSQELTARFSHTLDSLLRDPLSEGSMEREIIRMRDAIAAEMPTHIRRWRRPLTMKDWQWDVEYLRSFALLRPTAVKEQAEAYFAKYPLP